MPNKQQQTGFTLVEVLVALVVFSVGALSLTYAVANATNNQINLEQQTLAAWQAKNKLVSLRVSGFPNPGESSDSQTYAHREWKITTKVTPVDIPVLGAMLRQVQVDVADNQSPEVVIQSLRAVLGQN